jgi:hypothetical protein
MPKSKQADPGTSSRQLRVHEANRERYSVQTLRGPRGGSERVLRLVAAADLEPSAQEDARLLRLIRLSFVAAADS